MTADPTEPADEDLLAAYQQGDIGAFGALLRRHRAPLFTFFLRMLGDRAQAEDLAQETFLRVVKGAQAWQQRARFHSWLFTIARNLCVDRARRETVRGAGSFDAGGPDGSAPPGDALAAEEPDPVRGDGSARLRPLLQSALLALTQEQREVFVLREQAGASFREIAEMVSANEDAVKSRMRGALEGLRSALAEAGLVDGDEAPSAGRKQGA